MYPETRSRAVRFGEFELDASAYELRRQGRHVRLERRPMELLLLLVDRRGALVSRDEILDRLWGRDVFIDVDASVNTVIRKVRRALGESADDQRYIQTIPGKGYRFTADVEAPDARAVLAVLPFDNLDNLHNPAGAADRNYIADGLTEETIVGLGRIDPERVSVIGRTSSMSYRQTAKSVSDIGRELGADFLVAGSVRGADGRLRITATLIRVLDQVQMWTEAYERDAGDLLTLQAELGRGIAAQIHERLSPQRALPAARQHTQNPQAYDLYLRGRYYYNQMTPASAARALDCFRRATDVDHTYALAWAGIADACASRLFNSDTPSAEVAADARDAAGRALRAGAEVAEAHTAMARVEFLFDWDWRGSESRLRRALALDEASAQTYWMLGHALSHQGAHDRALAAAARARAIEPLDALTRTMSAQIAFSARRFDEAARHARDALQAEPDFWVAYWQLGQACEQLGDSAAALDALAEATRLSNNNSKPVSVSAYILARIGRADEARALAAGLERRAAQGYLPPTALALASIGVDRERVLVHLERALAARDVHLIYLPLDPKWDALRSDPAFAAFVERCGVTG